MIHTKQQMLVVGMFSLCSSSPRYENAVILSSVSLPFPEALPPLDAELRQGFHRLVMFWSQS